MNWEVRTMQSKTSFFNAAIFKKNTTRFWPIWVCYFVIWLISAVVPLMMNLSLNNYYFRASDLLNRMGDVGIVFGLFFGIIAAAALWSYLFNARSASFMASLPVRREGMFFTNYLTGLIWFVGVNIVTTLLLMAVMAANGVFDMAAAMGFFGAVTLSGIFSYSFATLLAMTTGSMIMLPIFYFILNFAWVIIRTFAIEGVISSLMYGVVSNEEVLTELSPLVRMIGAKVYSAGEYLGRDWFWFGIYAAIGLVFAVIALVAYKKRNMESAGDVVSSRALRPVFKYFTTFSGAIVFGIMLFMMFGYGVGRTALVPLIICMVIACFFSYYLAEMLIHKSFRVMKTGARGFLIASVIIAVTLFAIDMDILGLERKVPEASEVERVIVRGTGEQVTVLRETENIELTIMEHKDFVKNKGLYDNSERGYWMVWFQYYMKDGSLLERRYNVLYDEPLMDEKIEQLDKVWNSREGVASRIRPAFPVTSESISSFHVEFYDPELGYYTGKSFGYLQAVEFYNDYLLRDCENGTIGKVTLGGGYREGDYSVQIQMDIVDPDTREYLWLYLYVSPEAENVIRWLEENGIPMAYSPQEEIYYD